MQEHAHTRRNPVWRKIIVVAFLPIITFIWMIGWVLTQIGSQEGQIQIRQKTMHPQTEFEAHTKESEASTEDIEDSNIAYEPEIIA